MANQVDIEERVARDLLRYFTGQHPTGVRYEDQPVDVKDLWIGAARVAINAVQVAMSEAATRDTSS
jgi:hypothetical protein